MDYYTGFTQSEVETILATQKEELKKALESYSTAGDSVTRRKVDDVNKIITACQAALRKFDPEQYGGKRIGAIISKVGILPR